MCTRLFKYGYVHKRGFMIFDRDKPYELVLRLYRHKPKIEPSLNFGISPKGGFIPILTTETSYIKYKRFRMENKEKAELILDEINKDYTCIKCGHPKNCTKKLIKNEIYRYQEKS